MMLLAGWRRSRGYCLLDTQYFIDNSGDENIRSWDDGVEG